MGNINDTLASIENGLPSQVSIDDAWLAKIAAQGNSLLGFKGDLKEKAETYITAQIPNDPLPTPSPGSPLPDTNLTKKLQYAKKQADVATDTSKAATTISKYVKMVNDIKAKIEEKYQNGMNSINSTKEQVTNKLTKEEKKLFGNEADKKLEKAKEKIKSEMDKKKELIKVDIA